MITVAPVAQMGRPGSRLCLSCVFKGSPSPHVIWYRNGKRVDENSVDRSEIAIRNTETSSQLCIENLQAKFVGEYTVSIRNTYGEDLASAEVGLKSKQRIWFDIF